MQSRSAMSEQRTIFGTEELHISNLKSLTYQLLDRTPFLAEGQHAHLVALQLAKNMNVGVVSTEETITMRKSTYNWIVQNIPNIERYIRDYNEEHQGSGKRYHVPIESSDDIL